MEIKTFKELEDEFNRVGECIFLHDGELVDITITDEQICMNVYIYEDVFCWHYNLFKDVWEDPKHNVMHLRLTYYKPQITSNDIDMSVICGARIDDNISESRINIDKRLEKNQRIFIFCCNELEDDALDFNLEFKFETYKWEVVRMRKYDDIHMEKYGY